MFLGEYTHNLTSGKRLALPKRIRDFITGNEVVLTKGFEPCIAGFDKKVWEDSAQQELAVPVSEPRGREIRRQLFSSAQILEIDIQGRVVLPDTLISWAGITNELVIIGAGDHFEIWNSNTWKSYIKRLEESNTEN